MTLLNDEFHEEVAVLALKAAHAHGFALGGGHAFVAHGLIDRRTEDVDLFTDVDGAEPAAADAVCAELASAGMSFHRDDGNGDLADLFEDFSMDMVELYVTRGDQGVRLSLARLDRTAGPVLMEVGPVLHIHDVVGSKVAALAGRAEIRDFSSTWQRRFGGSAASSF